MEKLEAWPESLTHSVFGSQSLESCDNTACKAKSLCDSTAKNSEFGLQWRLCMQLHNCDGACSQVVVLKRALAERLVKRYVTKVCVAQWWHGVLHICGVACCQAVMIQ